MVKSEHGGEVAREMVEGLVIMREADAQRPCYWTCPACSHSKFESAKGFLDHVEQMHEEVQMLDASTPISCHQCHHEVPTETQCPPSCTASVAADQLLILPEETCIPNEDAEPDLSSSMLWQGENSSRCCSPHVWLS